MLGACGLAFAMVMRLIPTPLWLSVVTYFASVGGLFLGIIGIAMRFGGRGSDRES